MNVKVFIGALNVTCLAQRISSGCIQCDVKLLDVFFFKANCTHKHVHIHVVDLATFIGS